MLVRRRHEGQPETRREATALLDGKALPVHRNGNDRRPAGNETIACADRPRILEPYGIAAIEQHAADQVERLLRSVHDEYLFGIAGHAAAGAQMVRNRIPQRGQPGRLGIAHDLIARLAPVPGRQPRPDRHRKSLVVRQAGDERPRLAGMVETLKEFRRRLGDEVRELGRHSAAVVRGGRNRPQRRAHDIGNERARTGSCRDQPLRYQALEHGYGGSARYLQFRCQGPARRQAFSRRQVAGKDEMFHRAVNLRGDRFGRVPVDGNRQQQLAGRTFHHPMPPWARGASARANFENGPYKARRSAR